jgi:hypothetical protein
MSFQASNEVIKQAHALRQSYKQNFLRKISKKTEPGIGCHEYVLKDVPVRLETKKKRFVCLPKLNFLANSSNRTFKTLCIDPYPKLDLSNLLFSVKTLETSETKISNSYFTKKKPRFSINLKLPTVKCKPPSQ